MVWWSQEIRNSILRPPNWLHLEIIMKVMNHWQSTTLVESNSHLKIVQLLPTMQTKRWHLPWRDATVSGAWKPELLKKLLEDSRTDAVKRLLQVYKTCKLVGRTPMHPPGSCWGCGAGPMFHGQDENYTAPPESEIQLFYRPSSPDPLNRPYQGGLGVWASCSWNTPCGPSF